MHRTSVGRQHTPKTTHALNSTPLATSVTTTTVRRAPFAVQNVHAAGMSATTGTTHTIHSSAECRRGEGDPHGK